MRRLWLGLVAGAVLLGLTAPIFGEGPSPPGPRGLHILPTAPAAPSPQTPLPGPRPYYGQTLGAVYYNWGYFGAQQHRQISRSSGYYNDRRQTGLIRGY
jgi:hypothetical protein